METLEYQTVSKPLVTKQSKSLDYRAWVLEEASIPDIINPYEGLIVYCKEVGKHFKITEVSTTTVGGLTITRVEKYEPLIQTEVNWEEEEQQEEEKIE